MARVTLPSLPVNGTTVDAVALDAIFNALLAGVNSVDQTQLAAGAVAASLGSASALTQIGWYSVKDPAYGAIGNGVADDTTAIQNALNAINLAGGGILWLGGGVNNYKLSGLLTVYSNTTVLGAGYGLTTFTQHTLTSDIFVVAAGSKYVIFSGFDATYSAQATAGNVFNLLAGTTASNLAYIYIKECAWTSCFNGISCNGVLAMWVDKCVSSIGAPGNTASNFNIGTQTNPTTGLIYQSSQISITSNSFGGTNSGQGLSLGSVNGLVSSNNNYFGFGFGFYAFPTYSASSSVVGTPYVYNCTFSNDSWDKSGGYSIQWSPGSGGVIESIEFANCWTGGAGNIGWYINPTGTGIVQGIAATGHRFFNNTSYGFYVATGTGVSNIVFTNTFAAGVAGTGIGTSTGVVLLGGSHIKFLGGIFGQQCGYQGLAYGFNLNTSATTYLKIVDVDVTGNTVGIFNPGGATWAIRNNEGYNGTLGYLGTLAAPGSATATQNTSGVDQTLTITGGTVTYIAHGTQANCTGATPPGATGLTSGSIPWKAGEYFSVVYSSAPTIREYEA